MTTSPTSSGEIGLALAAMLILFFPLMQPAILLVVMFALVPAQMGAQVGIQESVMEVPATEMAQPVTRPKPVLLRMQLKPPDKLPQKLTAVQD